MPSVQNSLKQNLNNKQDFSQEILRAVEAIKLGSGFGSIEILLHDGRVMQIEKREKLRFIQDASKRGPTA